MPASHFQAYFGGEARCDAEAGQGDDYDPSELICGACSDVSRAQVGHRLQVSRLYASFLKKSRDVTTDSFEMPFQRVSNYPHGVDGTFGWIIMNLLVARLLRLTIPINLTKMQAFVVFPKYRNSSIFPPSHIKNNVSVPLADVLQARHRLPGV